MLIPSSFAPFPLGNINLFSMSASLSVSFSDSTDEVITHDSVFITTAFLF